MSAPAPTRAAAPSAAEPHRPRIAALDAARALGVVAMVVGHTLDALLSPETRAAPAVVAYWKARGLTAPLFMMVSGWAVTVAIGRGRARGPTVLRGRLPRVLLLLVIGCGLRWPGWGADRLALGDREVWAHLLAFDALHTIAISLLVAAAVLSLPWSAREKAWTFAALAVLAVALGLRAPAPLPVGWQLLPRSLAALAAVQAAGGTSPFPLFPWSAYFFAGGVLALLAGGGGGRRAAAMAAIGGALVAATCWTGVGTMPSGDPVLVLFRIGVILLILAALSIVPAAAAARVAPLGRASLGVYAIHLPVVYGWSTFAGLAQRIGPTRAFLPALLIAGGVLAASFILHVAVKRARGVVEGAVMRVLGGEGGPAGAGE